MSLFSSSQLTCLEHGFLIQSCQKSCIQEVPSAPHLYWCSSLNPFPCYYKCCFIGTKLSVVFHDHICSSEHISVLDKTRFPAGCILYDSVIGSVHNFKARLFGVKNYKRVDRHLQGQHKTKFQEINCSKEVLE